MWAALEEEEEKEFLAEHSTVNTIQNYLEENFASEVLIQYLDCILNRIFLDLCAHPYANAFASSAG